tara:strand:- start:568 stop:801 length:234 start_codon:yes stop_codon:yes gene_type:complete
LFCVKNNKIMDKKLIKELRELIDLYLKDCEDSGIYPTICNLKSDKNGKAKIYEMVLKICLTQDFTIGEAIAHIESSY